MWLQINTWENVLFLIMKITEPRIVRAHLEVIYFERFTVAIMSWLTVAECMCHR
jgi:hypothetical protein